MSRGLASPPVPLVARFSSARARRAMVQIDAILTTAPIPALAEAFASAGRDLYLVGGPVRDLLLGRVSADLDFTTDAHPTQVKQLLRRAGADHIFAIGEKFGTIGGIFGDDVVEITT